MTTGDPDKPRHFVEFEHPIPAKIMSIDGTWGGDVQLINISDTEAEIEAVGKIADLAEFFLLLTGFGQPVYRRCKRKWVHGARIGVSFNNSKIKPDQPRQKPPPGDG
jgi:hypothetical protein